eukprot:6638073-Karenia_brevis.AAC.1
MCSANLLTFGCPACFEKPLAFCFVPLPRFSPALQGTCSGKSSLVQLRQYRFPCIARPCAV